MVLEFKKVKKMQLVQNLNESHADLVKVILSCVLPLTLKRTKFLVRPDMTFGQFIHKIRESFLKLKEGEALFCFAKHNNSETLIPISNLMSSIQKEYSQPNGEVHLILRSEEVFG